MCIIRTVFYFAHFLYIGSTEVWTSWPLTCKVRTVLFEWWPSLFFTLAFIWIGSCVFCLRLALDRHHLTYALCSWDYIIDTDHHAQLDDWDRVSLTFCSGCPWSAILPIFTSQVVGITGIGATTPGQEYFLKNKANHAFIYIVTISNILP
jgi:hypothetical protein